MADTIDITVDGDDVLSLDVSEDNSIEITVEDSSPDISFTLAEAAGGGVVDHGLLAGKDDDDHTHYSLADGSRWTTSPGTSVLPRVDASGNLIASDLLFNGSLLDLNNNYIQVRDFAQGGALFVGSTLLKGSLVDNESLSTFTIQRTGGKLLLVGGTEINLQAAGGDVFVWPSADGSAGYVMKTDGLGSLSLADPNALISAATDTTAGKVELATPAEVDTGIDDTRAITPASLAGSYVGYEVVEQEPFRLKTGDMETVTVGNGAISFSIPAKLNGWKLYEVYAYCGDAGITGNLTLRAYNETQAVDMLNSALVIASGSTTSGASSIDTANDDVATNDIIRTDIDTVSTTPQAGLKVRYTFKKP